MATSVEEKSFSGLVPHLKLLHVITLGDLIKLQYTREEYPNLSLGNLFSQLIDIVFFFFWSCWGIVFPFWTGEITNSFPWTYKTFF